MMLHVAHAGVRYGDMTILDDVSFDVHEGEWWMIAGPNGAGKSTLLGAISQGIRHTGTIEVDGEDASRIKPQALARKMGVLMQNHAVGYSFTVEEIVRLGRYSHSRGMLRGAPVGDADAVEDALTRTGLTDLRGHNVLTLSGGELQRTFLAQLLAQDPPLMLLDEPTNHLDLLYQKEIFRLVRQWLDRPGRAVVSVVHDLSLARMYGTHALLLDKGRTVACGEVSRALSTENLNAVYGMDVGAWMRGMLGQWNDKDSQP